jgi:hypothetical protein
MKSLDVLEEDLVWDDTGHLSEIAKSALADGQDAILSSRALSHFAQCHACIESVGEAALLSVELGAALRGARAPRRFAPWIPIGAALAIAALSAIPMLSVARLWLSTTGSFVVRVPRILGRAAVEVAAHGFAPTFYLASTLVLLAMGFAVTRLMPRVPVQATERKGFSS